MLGRDIGYSRAFKQIGKCHAKSTKMKNMFFERAEKLKTKKMTKIINVRPLNQVILTLKDKHCSQTRMYHVKFMF